ncbi:MAG: response regulator transcription factor [Chloroflexi bacterium]|nr:response regulator transcription factor [Chloroflexota bacterium]
MTVTILLIDDHPLIRQGLRNLLGSESEFQVIGEAADGLQAIQLLERLHPNVVITDLMMPDMNGMEVLRHVKKHSPDTRSIVLSMYSSEPYVAEALREGASGYVLKDAGPSELVTAIHEVLEGRRYLSEKLAVRLEAAELEIENAPADVFETLTAREREILQMAAHGLSSTEIGEKLSISPRTVEVHRSRFMKKLSLRGQKDLILYAVKRGILSMEQ